MAICSSCFKRAAELGIVPGQITVLQYYFSGNCLCGQELKNVIVFFQYNMCRNSVPGISENKL